MAPTRAAAAAFIAATTASSPVAIARDIVDRADEAAKPAASLTLGGSSRGAPWAAPPAASGGATTWAVASGARTDGDWKSAEKRAPHVRIDELVQASQIQADGGRRPPPAYADGANIVSGASGRRRLVSVSGDTPKRLGLLAAGHLVPVAAPATAAAASGHGDRAGSAQSTEALRHAGGVEGRVVGEGATFRLLEKVARRAW